MQQRLTSDDLFGKLNGNTYATYRELEEGIVGLFNRHLMEFPPHYSYRQLIEWVQRNNWILGSEETGFRIHVEGTR